MAKASRDKGCRGELEAAKVLYEELGIRLVRNLEQWRRGGTDLVPSEHPDNWGVIEKAIDRYGIEVKRQASDRPLRTWWKQACDQAARGGYVPCLMYRVDYRDWMVCLPASEFRRGGGMDFQHRHTITVPEFGMIIRERAL